MVANFIAFFATIIALVAIEVSTGGQTATWLRISIGILIFGIANAFNVNRRHAPKTKAATAPILDSKPTLEGVVDLQSSQSSFATEMRSSLAGTGLDIGHMVDGRLMLTRDEVQRVLGNWQQFNNVICMMAPAPVMNPGGEVPWYLVVSPTSGVFFNRAADQVWTVLPEGLSITRHPISDIVTGLAVRSIDGRTEKVQSGDANTWDCIHAWTSNSYEDFCKGGKPGTAGWGLLARELQTGHSPHPFLRWHLPYEDVKQGVTTIQSEPEVLAKFVRAIDMKRAKPWLDKLGLAPQAPIYVALELEKHRRFRRNVIAVACVVALMSSVFTWSSYSMRALRGQTALVIVCIVAVLALALILWAQFQYLKQSHKLQTSG